MSKSIEKFNVEIEREGAFFVAIIKFQDGEERATQGKNIVELYDMIADLLKCRLEWFSYKTKSGSTNRKKWNFT